jgi:RNA polymerase sigma factor (sigma-70 family)
MQMPNQSDMELLQDYDRQGLQEAFAEVVQRHVNLVYSVALRHVGIAAQAEEIAQAVFVILARKAASLRPDTVLESWLYETARLTSLSFMRSERRRQMREQEAYMQSTLNESTNTEVWNQLAPMLDEAMSGLSSKDRDAVVLRFFKEKNLSEVAANMEISESAAQSRVHRAVEKLRKFFVKRGVAFSSVAIVGAISAHSVQAAPVGLAQSISVVALAKGAAASSSTSTIIKGALKLMAWTKAKTTMVACAVVLLAAGTTTLAVKNHHPSASPQNLSGPVDMRINFPVGRKYSMHIDMDQTTNTAVPNLPEPIVQGVKIGQDFDVSAIRELDGGGRQLELKFTGQTMNISQGGRTMLSFDSAGSPAQDAGNPAASILRSMLGSSLEYFTDATGRVERMEGQDELLKRVAAVGNPESAALLNQLYSKSTLEQYASYADSMPDHSVSIGDGWEVKKDLNTPIGVLGLDLQYSFKNWEQHGDRKCMHVEFTGTIKTKNTSTETGMEIGIKKGKVTGEMWFDPALGMIVEVNSSQDLLLAITTRTQTMDSRFTRNNRISLVDVTP